ncbi:MAG: HAD family phosphatase [Candidatus Thermoplasmatota archaeon]|jgi:phosphoserine phosphatase|nr:HAD family phosphatase [Candidatus Thermoplasmatota archaeon]MED5273661.1 HAD family phosphatase [Candidatus Thermoplasmatota archaeon]
MKDVVAVVFDCDGVLTDNGSSWQNIHDYFGTENKEMLRRFLAGEISDDEFMADDIRLWTGVSPEIHRDDIMRAYSGIGLMPGARDVVEELKRRGVYVAIVSAGVDVFVGAIANMLSVDDWAANGFDWDEEGFLRGPMKARVLSHEKDIMVDKLSRINNMEPAGIFSVGDSSTDLSMMIDGSSFIGFNPARDLARDSFREAGVPVVEGNDLRDIWPHIFDGEEFPN